MEDRKRKGEPLSQEPRKRSRNDDLPASAIPSAVNPPTATNAAPPSSAGAAVPGGGISASILEAAQRAAILRAQALTGMSVGTSLPPQEGPTAASTGVKTAKKTVLPPPLVVDSTGKAIEDVMSIPVQRVTTLKINDPSRVAPPKSATITAGIPTHNNRSSGPATDAASYNPYLAHRRVVEEPMAAPTPVEPTAAGEGLVLTKTLATSSHSDNTGANTTAIGVDPRIPIADPDRKRQLRAKRALNFADQGRFIEEAEELRERAAKQAEIAAFREKGSRMRPAFHHELEDATANGGANGAAGTEGGPGEVAKREELSTITLPAKHRGFILGKSASNAANPAGLVEVIQPEIEWWDAAFLPGDRAKEFEAYMQAMKEKLVARNNTEEFEHEMPFSYNECSIANQKTFTYVQHPVPILSAADEETLDKPIVIPLMLTKLESKRLRRKQRAERHKELLDKQRMGLLPPPEPKVRLANLMRVLTDAAVADPSAVEARVREQQAQRVKNHEMRNLAKQLTPEERADKWKTKMTQHGAQGPECALFRVPALLNKKIRSIIDLNAKGTYLTGLVLECRSGGYSLIYVEGGTRAIRKYTRLFQRRIKWHEASKPTAKEDDEDDEDSSDSDTENIYSHAVTANGYGSGLGSKCELVWQGTAPKRFFEDFRFEATKTPAAARKLLSNRGLAHMWDIVMHSAKTAGEEATGEGDGEGGNMSTISALFSSGGFLQNPLFAQPKDTGET